MQYTVLIPKDTAKRKKGAATKKVGNKNKEFTFKFDPAYMSSFFFLFLAVDVSAKALKLESLIYHQPSLE